LITILSKSVIKARNKSKFNTLVNIRHQRWVRRLYFLFLEKAFNNLLEPYKAAMGSLSKNIKS